MKTSLSKVNPADFDAVIDGKKVGLFILKNKNGIEMSVTNFGGRVVELFTPDKNGEFADIVLGKETLDEYVNFKDERFLGATIGRFGNRIANSQFTLNGTVYKVPVNDGKNSLHGGFNGFDMKVWDVVEATETKLHLRLISPDGDEGYPAELTVDMIYSLNDANEFDITYTATSDADTHVNLTHHSFFNLHGAGVGDINDHVMQINADKYTPIDDTLIPEGEPASVEGTPLDFRKPTVIGERVDDDFIQLKRGNGYDHNWVLNKTSPDALEFAAEVFEPNSGRVLSVYTTEPAMQFYGGNFFTGTPGKWGAIYNRRASLALETQHYPDSPNRPDFPSTLLRKGETYKHICKYVFSVRK